MSESLSDAKVLINLFKKNNISEINLIRSIGSIIKRDKDFINELIQYMTDLSDMIIITPTIDMSVDKGIFYIIYTDKGQFKGSFIQVDDRHVIFIKEKSLERLTNLVRFDSTYSSISRNDLLNSKLFDGTVIKSIVKQY